MPDGPEWRPVVVLPLWRRGEVYGAADRPGVSRGHSGPVAVDQVAVSSMPPLPPAARWTPDC
ncbi:hypothetical protein ACIPLC_10795 [Kitasatospora sp. NPDC086801]|uniref:hypothetical protein n=1 Tax=Kitasatospora sp. NPDC086801 TaxID=3364066 RepID=UPI0037F7300F